MSNILKAHVAIRGTRPLIQHRFGPDSLPIEKRERTGIAGNDPEEWRRTSMITKQGQLYLGPTYIFGCLRDGAKHEVKKRGTWQPFVAATLQVVDEVILIDRYFPGFPNEHDFDIAQVQPPGSDETLPVFLHICSVKNPATRARNVRYRIAAATGWKTTFGIMWDKTVVDRNVMQAVVHDAGMFCGLGDGRSVGFGRFTVESFDIE